MFSSRNLYKLTKIVAMYAMNAPNQPVTVQILGAASGNPSAPVPIGASIYIGDSVVGVRDVCRTK